MGMLSEEYGDRGWKEVWCRCLYTIEEYLERVGSVVVGWYMYTYGVGIVWIRGNSEGRDEKDWKAFFTWML